MKDLNETHSNFLKTIVHRIPEEEFSLYDICRKFLYDTEANDDFSFEDKESTEDEDATLSICFFYSEYLYLYKIKFDDYMTTNVTIIDKSDYRMMRNKWD